LNDFQPLSLLTDAPFFLAARKTFPADDLKGLIAWMKANPGRAIFGNGGNGSISHISGLLFMDLTRTTAQVVPYRGNAPAMQDLVGGQIDIMVADPVTGVPQVKGGSIKAYAVMAKSRLATAPEIPTVDEAGLPGYHVSLWHGFWMPRGTPQPIMAKLNAAIVEALADPTVQTKLAMIGQDIFPRERQNPQALDAHQKAEIAKWWPLIKAAEIQVGEGRASLSLLLILRSGRRPRLEGWQRAPSVRPSFEALASLGHLRMRFASEPPSARKSLITRVDSDRA